MHPVTHWIGSNPGLEMTYLTADFVNCDAVWLIIYYHGSKMNLIVLQTGLSRLSCEQSCMPGTR